MINTNVIPITSPNNSNRKVGVGIGVSISAGVDVRFDAASEIVGGMGVGAGTWGGTGVSVVVASGAGNSVAVNEAICPFTSKL